jgi:hypothetical protein
LLVRAGEQNRTLAASGEANPVFQEEIHMAPWRAVAEREWGTTASWIKGDGQYAVLHPCGGELTVTLCATPAQAKDAKVDRCGGRCTRSRHTVTDLHKAFGEAVPPAPH